MNVYSGIEGVIQEKMARCFHVSNWVAQMEAAGTLPKQVDFDEVAPETPDVAYLEAARQIGRIEQANGMSLICIYAQACKADGLVFEDVAKAWWDDDLDNSPR